LALRDKATYVGKAIGRRVAWAPSDVFNGLRDNGALVPPRGLSFVGRSDFEKTGQEFLGHFVELGGLRPEHRVLDIGCGIGRMAIPLTGYLDRGSYEGFDVGKEMVGWCKRRITARYPSFQFAWAPIFNRKYNPFGTVSAGEFRFPYEDDSFDFAFATSLFTHMTGAEVRHYLAEIQRVLKPGGKALLTFFLITPESEAEIDSGRAAFEFSRGAGDEWTTDPRLPEEAIAFELDQVREMIGASGLSLREPIHRGGWAQAPAAPSLQDIIVVESAEPQRAPADV
jgi:SAM-dependent methyltransferase